MMPLIEMETKILEYEGKKVFDRIIDQLTKNQSSLADSDYSEMFLEWFNHSMFYNVDTKKYHIFNRKYYQVDNEALLLKKEALCFATELVEYANKRHVDSAVMQKIYGTKSTKRIDRIVETLKILRRVESEEVDQYDDLFNVQNGLLNIDTGKLSPHSPKYKITQIADVEYHPELGEVDGEAREIFLSFFLSDEEVLEFLFEYLGICLSGKAGYRKFVYAFGSGKNGKSTLFNFFLNEFFGNYGAPANFQTFCGTRDNTRASSDLVPLLGKRLVLTNESQTNQKLNTNLLKSVTGGDKTNARLNFQDDRTFQPHCKIVMFGNNQLEIDDSSEGMQDRYVQIPFMAKFDKNNQRSQKELWRILSENKSQILNSLLAGYQRVENDGFSEIKSIQEASLEGFASANNFIRFIKENLKYDERLSVKVKNIYDRYKEFSLEEELNGNEKISRSEMINSLKSSGYKIYHDRTYMVKNYRLLEKKSQEI